MFINGWTLPSFSQNPRSATLFFFFTRFVLHARSYSIHVANINNPFRRSTTYVVCIVVSLFSTRLVLPAWVTRWGKDESSLRFRVTSLPQVPTTSDSWNLKNLRIANTLFTCLSQNPKSPGLGDIPDICHFWYATTLFRPVERNNEISKECHVRNNTPFPKCWHRLIDGILKCKQWKVKFTLICPKRNLFHLFHKQRAFYRRNQFPFDETNSEFYNE